MNLLSVAGNPTIDAEIDRVRSVHRFVKTQESKVFHSRNRTRSPLRSSNFSNRSIRPHADRPALMGGLVIVTSDRAFEPNPVRVVLVVVRRYLPVFAARPVEASYCV